MNNWNNLNNWFGTKVVLVVVCALLVSNNTVFCAARTEPARPEHEHAGHGHAAGAGHHAGHTETKHDAPAAPPEAIAYTPSEEEKELMLEIEKAPLEVDVPETEWYRTDTVERLLKRTVIEGFIAAFRLAITKHPNLNSGFGGDTTILAAAAGLGRVECINMLLAAGADINLRNRGDGSTALHTAADSGQLDAVQALLSAGADIKILDNDHYTALHAAANWATHIIDPTPVIDCIKALIVAGAETNLGAHGAHTTPQAQALVDRCVQELNLRHGKLTAHLKSKTATKTAVEDFPPGIAEIIAGYVYEAPTQQKPIENAGEEGKEQEKRALSLPEQENRLEHEVTTPEAFDETIQAIKALLQGQPGMTTEASQLNYITKLVARVLGTYIARDYAELIDHVFAIYAAGFDRPELTMLLQSTQQVAEQTHPSTGKSTRLTQIIMKLRKLIKEAGGK